VSRSIRILLVAVVAVVAVGGYWKLALAPKRAEVAKLDQEVATQEAQLAQTQSLIATYQGAQKDYKANYATMVRLGKAVPADDDMRSLMVQLDTSAKRSNIDFDTINLNAGGGGAGATAGATSPTPGAINAGAYSAMPFSFGFVGTFDTLGNFLSRLERFVSLDGDKINVNGRLLRVESLSLQPGDTGWPSLGAKVGASAYIVPKAADPAIASGTTTTPPSTTTAASPSTGTSTAASGTNAG
jgi:Tfp pilus assembly protein PilO